MGSLSQSDKEYWRLRLEDVIDKKRRQVIDQSDQPDFVSTTKQEAWDRLVESKGLGSDFARLEDLTGKIDALEAERKSLKNAIAMRLFNSRHASQHDHEYGWRSSIDQRPHEYTGRRGEYVEKPSQLELLARKLYPETELGRKIIALNELQDSLNDRIMYATTSASLQAFIRLFQEKTGLTIVGDEIDLSILAGEI